MSLTRVESSLWCYFVVRYFDVFTMDSVWFCYMQLEESCWLCQRRLLVVLSLFWSHGVRQLCQMNKSNQRAMESGNLYSRIRRKWKSWLYVRKIDLVPALAEEWLVYIHTHTCAFSDMYRWLRIRCVEVRFKALTCSAVKIWFSY